MKSFYALNAYQSGSKSGKSLVVVIPAAIVREFGLSTDTILALRVKHDSNIMTLEPLKSEAVTGNDSC